MANNGSVRTGPTGAPGIIAPTPNVQVATRGGIVPWRKATLRKTERAFQTTHTITAAQQLVNGVLEGTGFLERVSLDVNAVAAGNIAAVAFTPDAPWSALSSVVFKDVGPDLVNLSGYDLFLVNLYGGFGRDPLWPASTDPNVYNLDTAGGDGGSFRAVLDIPLAINNRSLIGVLGNQDRAVKYELRTDLAADALIYTVNPTALPTVTTNRTLHFATVPAPEGARRQKQEQIPPHYGVVHTLMSLRSEANPVASSPINHFLRGIGNTIRYVILVARLASGARSDTMVPTLINFRVGSDIIFSESGARRRQIMRDHYGFDAPAGVLVYDFMQEFGARAGYELGDDWLNTRDVANAQFEITWPAFAGGAGSLTVITDSLIIPEGLDLAAYA